MAFVAGLVMSSPSVGQPDMRQGEPEGQSCAGASVPLLVSFFAPFVIPKLLQDNGRLKDYVCSDELAEVRREHGDLQAVDAMFDRACALAWGNTSEALLLCMTATLDHRRFGVRLPVLGALLWVPLTSEFDDDFQRRISALPRQLYADTPPHGDRDKLQHFFGSAFLAHLFASRGVAERIGGFIEWGEERFIVDGALDDRDFRANRQGQDFGLRLLDDASVRPSDLLISPLADRRAPFSIGCAGLSDSSDVSREER